MVHFFDSDIAKKYGVNAAVLACFLWDCIEQKSTESPQLHEGKVWVRCSVQMMTGLFPFLSYSGIGINRLRELINKGEIEYIQNGNRCLLADKAIWDWYDRCCIRPESKIGGG